MVRGIWEGISRRQNRMSEVSDREKGALGSLQKSTVAGRKPAEHQEVNPEKVFVAVLGSLE